MKVHQKAIDKIMEYAKKARDAEIGGLLMGTKYTDGDFEIEDAILIKQHRNYTAFSLDNKALADFTKNASDKELWKVCGWWHSHANMDTFYSSDDDKTFQRLAEFFQHNACIGVVVNLKGSQHWRVLALTKGNTYVDIDNVQPEIEKPIEKYVVDTSDFKGKVIDDFKYGKFATSGAYDTCEACDGEGIVRQRSCPDCKEPLTTVQYCPNCKKEVPKKKKKISKILNIISRSPWDSYFDDFDDRPNKFDRDNYFY